MKANGVHAAVAALAGARGGLKSFSDDDKKAAAKKLMGLYRTQLHEDPPDTLLTLAGEQASGATRRPARWPTTWARPDWTHSSGRRWSRAGRISDSVAWHALAQDAALAVLAPDQQPDRPVEFKKSVRTQAGVAKYGNRSARSWVLRGTRQRRPRRRTQALATYQKLMAQAKNGKVVVSRLTNQQLGDRSKSAYSFKSGDPKVVAAHIAIANELARRGMNRRQYGALG